MKLELPRGVACLLVGGDEYELGGVRFEMHRYCGPMPIDKRTGNGRDLPASHPFWGRVTRVVQAGTLDQHKVGGE